MNPPSSLRLKPKNIQESNQSIPSSLKIKNKKLEEPSVEFESEEDTERNIERAQAQAMSRILETAVGAPGDIASFIVGLFGKEQNILPTSSDIRKFSEEKSRGYTSPKNEFEEKGGEIISDIAAMSLPGSGPFKFARNIGIPIAGAFVKEGLSHANASEKSQSYAKIGTMVALDLLSRRAGGVKAHIKDLYKKADEAIPAGLSIKATDLETSLIDLEKELTKGGSRPTTKKSLEKLREIREEITSGNGNIDVKRLAAYRPSINEAIDEIGGFNLDVPKKLKPQTIRNLNQVKGEVIQALNVYGKKHNPEFLKYNMAANEAYAAYAKSNRIANFIQNKVGYSPKSKAVQALFSLAPHAAAGAVANLSPSTALGAVAGIGIYNGIKVLERVRNSPTLRKYYIDTLKSAAKGNIPSTARSLKALDRGLSLEEKEDKARKK